MTDNKLVEFIEKLGERMTSGVLKWEKTAADDNFQTTLANFVILIVRRYAGREADYYIKLVDKSGDELESISDVDFRRMATNIGKEDLQTYEIMENIFKLAKRQASGLDKAIDDVIAELDDIPPF